MFHGFRDDPEQVHQVGRPERESRPVVTWTLLAANVVVWLLTYAAGGTDNPDVLLDFGAMFGPLIASGEYWRLFTAMFLHAGIPHLAFNCLALFIFGPQVERAYGRSSFTVIYILSGLSGSVASYLLNSISIGVGASGAIFGVIGALAAFLLVQRRVFGEMSRRTLYGLALMLGINLVYGLVTPGIDNWAHLGGLAAGLVLGWALAPKLHLVAPALGAPAAVVRAGTSLTRLWALAVLLALLVGGVWLAASTMPENAYTHLYIAERHYRSNDLEAALSEVNGAMNAADSMTIPHRFRANAEAFLLRGRIYRDMGRLAEARSDLGRAVAFGEFGSGRISTEAAHLLQELGRR